MISTKIKEAMQQGSAISDMFEKGKAIKAIYGADQVYDFSLGNPDVATPASVDEDLRFALAQAVSHGHGYMTNAGYEETRRVVAEREIKRSGVPVEPEGIVMTCGAAGALSIIFKSILDPGDEVVVFAPYFAEYRSYVQNAGGILKVLPTKPGEFLPDPNVFKQAISPRTKALLINSPNNPSGCVYDIGTLTALKHVLDASGQSIYVVSDEPYAEIIFGDTKLPSIFALFPNSIIAYSWSKSLSLPGERIGYVACNKTCEDYENLISALAYANRSLGFVNAPALMQRAVIAFADKHVDPKIYEKRRDMLYNILLDSGFSCFLSQGSFYLFPQSPILDEEIFVDECAEHRLLCTPGSAFGMPGHFRLSFCVSEETIKRSASVFHTLGKQYGLI